LAFILERRDDVVRVLQIMAVVRCIDCDLDLVIRVAGRAGGMAERDLVGHFTRD
jgi:hypothetical protein